MFKLTFIIALVIVCLKCENIDLKFPKDFLIGTASSAYQVEGAWNVSDKSVGLWDYFCHKYPERIVNHESGDIACDAYNIYEEDANILKDIGVDYYRFSISWSRILPDGRKGNVSKSGLDHYHKVLDSLEKNGVTPFVTIYHVDHPQILEDKGGWLKEEMIDEYVEFARIVFREFGSRVKFFTTINEPGVHCMFAYRNGGIPPDANLTGTGDYMCVHNMLKAHALAYHMYDKEFREKYNNTGKIGLVVQIMTPYSKILNDTSREIFYEFMGGWQLNPILSKTGDYPELMKRMVEERSKAQGLKESRLPVFSEDWIKKIKGSVDYVGINYYTSVLVEPLPKSSILDWPNDEGLIYTHDPEWLPAQSAWLKVHPKGFRDILNIIKDKYDNPPVYITENGVSDSNGTNDTLRLNYLYSYMKEMLLAIKEDNCNVKSYSIWSFLDSFEWTRGYAEQFGIISVDFSDKNRTRTLKNSAHWLRTVLKNRELHSPS